MNEKVPLTFLRRPPLQARGAQNIFAILQACEYLLGEMQAAEITIDKIAAHAEINVGSIYFFFKDKLDIFFSLIELALRHVSAQYAFSETELQTPIQEFITTLQKKLERVWNAHKRMLDLYFSFSSHPSIKPLVVALDEHTDTQLVRKLSMSFPTLASSERLTLARVINTHLMSGLDETYRLKKGRVAAFRNEWLKVLHSYIETLPT